MFANTTNFSSRIDVSQWNLARIKTMQRLFCKSKGFADNIASWNASKVADMTFVFDQCDNFAADVSDWDASNVQGLLHAFGDTINFTRKGFQVEHIQRSAIRCCFSRNEKLCGGHVGVGHVQSHDCAQSICHHGHQDNKQWVIITVDEWAIVLECRVL